MQNRDRTRKLRLQAVPDTAGQSFSEGNARAGMHVRAAVYYLTLVVSLRVSDSTHCMVDAVNGDLTYGLLATT